MTIFTLNGKPLESSKQWSIRIWFTFLKASTGCYVENKPRGGGVDEGKQQRTVAIAYTSSEVQGSSKRLWQLLTFLETFRRLSQLTVECEEKESKINIKNFHLSKWSHFWGKGGHFWKEHFRVERKKGGTKSLFYRCVLSLSCLF